MDSEDRKSFGPTAATGELSSRARAFSVEALLQHHGDTGNRTQDITDVVESPASPEDSDCSVGVPSPYASPLASPQDPRSSTPDAQLGTGQIEISGVRVELCGRELWQEFYQLGTEMIITKAGRRMFPSLKFRVSGLNPDDLYTIWLDIVSVDDKRYRYVYHSSQWMVAGSGDPPLGHSSYVHPESPAPGRAWTSQGSLAFDRLKLTNNRRPLVRGQVSLHSMHKYQPRVHIMRMDPGQELDEADMKKAMVFAFPETVFTTVTAYQNQQITRLKIASNPFAKGFRETAKTKDTSEETTNPFAFSSSDSPLRESLDANPGHSSTAGNYYPMYLPTASLLGASLMPMSAYSASSPRFANQRTVHKVTWLAPNLWESKAEPTAWPPPKLLNPRDKDAATMATWSAVTMAAGSPWQNVVLRQQDPDSVAMTWPPTYAKQREGGVSSAWQHLLPFSSGLSQHHAEWTNHEPADHTDLAWKQHMLSDAS